MKRVILILAALVLFCGAAAAEIDLSTMSYDELVDLSKQVGIAIMEHEDFESVSVPKGLWEVGVDIPEGTWILSSTNGSFVSVTYGTEIDDSGNDMNQYANGNTADDLEDDETWRVRAKNGAYFHIEYDEVTFTSDKGTTGLGFKNK